MDIKITFPGNKKVFAEAGGYVIETDQSIENGGDATAPSPYMYFLASIGTCSGIYVLSFCRERGIPTEGMNIIQHVEYVTGEKGEKKLDSIVLEIQVPPGFPDKYLNAIKKVAEQCAVKKTILNPPKFDVITKTAAG
ncbi:MAG: OsmC family protein [Nitrospiraceae bacterium]|nr:OsmC family protein [Nitrospiraceae bacterium]